jgi:DNA-binding transcriptional LysR family regulator
MNAKLHAGAFDWELLRSYLAVAEAGSLTRAALTLGVSQPTLSRHLADLEEVLGMPLLERSARKIVPTAAGLALLAPLQRMQLAAQDALHEVHHHSLSNSGTVRVAASEMIAAYVLPPILASLAAEHPDIHIELAVSNSIANLLEHEADVAVRMVRPTQGNVIARHLGDWPLGLYADESYLQRTGAGFSLEDAERFRWIGEDKDGGLIAGLRAAGLDCDRSFFRQRCDNHVVNMQLLLAGMGIGVVLDAVAARYPTLRRLAREKQDRLPVWLCAHRELRAGGRIQTVFDVLADGLQRFASGRS